jgi:hypothetical protein
VLAHAFLTILAMTMNDTEPDHDSGGLVPITPGEARRLFTALTTTASNTVGRILAWSRWRRREGSITAAHRPDLRL